MPATTETAAAAALVVPSRVLGAIEVDPADAIALVEPIAGFPECRQHALVPHIHRGVPSRSIHWFQALERPYHAFIVADPWSVFPDYAPEIPDTDVAALGLGSVDRGQLFVVLTVPSNPSGITANLRAPLLLNRAAGLAKQVVLLGDQYHTCHPVRYAVG